MNTQENIMLIAKNPLDTKLYPLGNDLYVTTPWVMSESVMHEFVNGTLSMHYSKNTKSFFKGRIIEVVSVGKQGSDKNRVAFIFKKEAGSVDPNQIRSRAKYTTSETREQVRY